MAVTATLIHATDHALVYAIAHTGGGADQITISNATLQTDAAGKPELLEMLQTPVANNAEAVILLMARHPGVSRITMGAAAFWHIDAEEDGANRARVVIDGQAGTANEGILELVRVHTIGY